MKLILMAVLALGTGHHPGHITRELGPIYCGTQVCHQHVTITKPWLDTDQVLTVVKGRTRPVEGRNSITPPWSRWHVLGGFIR